MPALQKAHRQSTEAEPQPKASSRHLEIATSDSTPVDSAAQQLRLHLETALAASRNESTVDDSSVEPWPRPVRAAILAGAIVVPWSLVGVAMHALASCSLFPWVY